MASETLKRHNQKSPGGKMGLGVKPGVAGAASRPGGAPRLKSPESAVSGDRGDSPVHKLAEWEEACANIEVARSWRAPGAPPQNKIIPVFSDLTINEARDWFVYPSHVHANYELILVTGGVYQCRVNGAELSLNAKHFLFVKPGDSHIDICLPPLSYVAVRFVLLSDHFPVGESPSVFHPKCGVNSQHGEIAAADYETIIDGLRAESQLEDAYAAHLQDAMLTLLFWRLVRGLPKKGLSDWFQGTTYENAFRVKLERFFNVNIAIDVNVAAMARHMGMGESSFAHKCRGILGVSPARALAIHKMGVARRMLGEPGVSVKIVAAALGFENSCHFSRSFKGICGFPPSGARSNRRQIP